MDQIYDRVAGLDVHRDNVVACFRRLGPRGGVVFENDRFRSTTAGLRELEAWLAERQVELVAMEATGVYWKPVYYALESRFTVWLCNARNVKKVPGRIDVVVPGVSILMSDETERRVDGHPRDDRAARSPAPTAAGRPSRVHYAAGAPLAPADEGANVTVLGSDIARQYDKRVGDTVPLRGEPFTVVGHPGADADGPGQTGDRAARRRPAPVRRRRCPSLVSAAAGPAGDRQRAHRLPEAGRRPRHGRRRDQGRRSPSS